MRAHLKNENSPSLKAVQTVNTEEKEGSFKCIPVIHNLRGPEEGTLSKHHADDTVREVQEGIKGRIQRKLLDTLKCTG